MHCFKSKDPHRFLFNIEETLEMETKPADFEIMWTLLHGITKCRDELSGHLTYRFVLQNIKHSFLSLGCKTNIVKINALGSLCYLEVQELWATNTENTLL